MNQIQQFFEYLFNSFKIWVIVQPWEAGLRVRNGKHIKRLSKGIYFKIPYFDSVYIQETRLRVREMPMQTLSTKDRHAITISSSIGYSITNIETLYNTLYRPEQTLQNIAMSELGEILFNTKSSDLETDYIESQVMEKLEANDYGLRFEYFKITNFAIVKTIRLIQDQTWIDPGISLTEKR